jgi:hypothetical protein
MHRLFGIRRRRNHQPLQGLRPAPASAPTACGGLKPLPEPHSPLVAEMMNLYGHSRHLAGLSKAERCPAEYLLVARSVVQHIAEGWQNQTDGCGTIEDLLLRSSASPPSGRPCSG